MRVNITCRYGSIDGVHRTPHTGIDLGFTEGTPLRSIGNGVAHVVDYGNANIGKGVLIEQADGTTAIYGHLSHVNVVEGQRVGVGDLIGATGNTGHSTGAHLHFGLKHNGHFIDPTAQAEKVMQYAGEHTFWQRFVSNGKIGDGVGEIPNHNIWRELYESIAVWLKSGFVDWCADMLIALPPIAVVSFGVYALCGIVSKRFAPWGARLTMLYGVLVLLAN